MTTPGLQALGRTESDKRIPLRAESRTPRPPWVTLCPRRECLRWRTVGATAQTAHPTAISTPGGQEGHACPDLAGPGRAGPGRAVAGPGRGRAGSE